MQFLLEKQWIIILILIWTIPWKGVALWKSAKNGHKYWFITFLILNTLAILEIFYLFSLSEGREDEFDRNNFGTNSKSNIDIKNNNKMFVNELIARKKVF